VSDQIDSIFAPPPEEPQVGLPLAELRVLLQRVANMIVAVGTGQARVQDVNNEYKKLDRKLSANFKALGFSEPFPWREMWEWYGYYRMELDTYQQRRDHVARLTKEALDKLNSIENTGLVHDPASGGDDPTWDRVNTRVAGLVDKYSSARTLDDWQDVGRRSREILVDLGKLLADSGLIAAGTRPPKLGDAKAWFDLMLAQRGAGSSKAEFRAVMRATWELAQKVTHGDIDDVDAFASAQATVLVVRTTQKLLAIEPGS
jgi:hypothetical protein